MARTKGKTVLLSDDELMIVQEWKKEFKNTYQIFSQFGITALPQENKIMSSTYEKLFKQPHATISASLPKRSKRNSKSKQVQPC